MSARCMSRAPGAPVNMLALPSRATIDVIGLAAFSYELGSSRGRCTIRPSRSCAFSVVSASRGFCSGPPPRAWSRSCTTCQRRVARGARTTMDGICGVLIAEPQGRRRAGREGRVRRRTSSRSSSARIRPRTRALASAMRQCSHGSRHSCSQGTRGHQRAPPLPTRARGNAAVDQDALAALGCLLLLDAVVRETMRLYAPVPSTIREAVQDAALPLAAPFTDGHGVQHHELWCAPAALPSTRAADEAAGSRKATRSSSRSCSSTARTSGGPRAGEWTARVAARPRPRGTSRAYGVVCSRS
jgi:hypothetical protein